MIHNMYFLYNLQVSYQVILSLEMVIMKTFSRRCRPPFAFFSLRVFCFLEQQIRF